VAIESKENNRSAWRYRVEVKLMPPAGTTTLRKAQVTWGTDSGTIEYVLSNAAVPV
jgi:hypothetical protein